MQSQTLKALGLLTLAVILLHFLIWLPHILSLNNFFNLDFSKGFLNIYRNYDGVNYIVIAKSLYNPEIISSIPNALSPNYYAAHFPGYALAILAFAPLLGFLKSMLFVTSLFTILSTWALYFLIRDFKLSPHPFYLSLVFLVLPARWLIVQSVGSAEPMFIFFTILAFYSFLSFQKSSHLHWVYLTAFFGSIAQFTRPPGILLFIALSLFLIWQYHQQKVFLSLTKTLKYIYSYSPLILIPLTLLAIFWGYSYSYDDFWAYFHSGDNIHLQSLPFSVFNKSQFWVGDIWLEDIIYILLIAFISGLYLLKNPTTKVIGFYVLTYTLITTLVAHRDISRYILPILPFSIIAFEKLLTSKEFKAALLIILLGIYLYSQNFLIQNTAPVPNLNYYN